HNDLPWNMRKYVHNQMGSFNFSKLDSSEPWKTSNWSHTDLTRLRIGMVGAQFWSAYVPCGAQFLDAVQLTLEQIDVIKRLAEMHPDSLRIATTVKGE
ncbi:Dipeptidase 1, partial [Frankliniella fusca]